MNSPDHGAYSDRICRDEVARLLAQPAPDVVRLFPHAGTLRGQQWMDVAELARVARTPFVYLGPLGSVELRGVADLDALVSALVETQLASALAFSPVLADPLDSQALGLARAASRTLRAGAHEHPPLAVAAETPEAPEAPEPANATSASNGSEATDMPWHAALREDPDVAEHLLQAVLADARAHLDPDFAPSGTAPIGWLEEHLPAGRVALGAGVQDRMLRADYAEMLGHMDIDVMITQWRTIFIPDIADGDAEVVIRFLAPRGFIFDAASPLL